MRTSFVGFAETKDALKPWGSEIDVLGDCCILSWIETVFDERQSSVVVVRVRKLSIQRSDGPLGC